ncbi:ABC transporter related [Gloeothece citriformis PCC 7424]|uniref:ABC transporter related n=1 Tax=Gloeothece citriformis (strain PCC 7424) TaxID=65393 RepID=B7K941_GLOC7|nr:ABC transporter ATP-binding protein [Gloeothece citriformis]ACK72810.1 ABC transporter related [Gloeothece citriformis PCC 7424]
MNEPVLEVRNLQVKFTNDHQDVLAVDEISFSVNRGEVLGIVGESGSGKSVTSLAVMGLIPTPGKISGGEIWFRTENEAKPVNLLNVDENIRREYRGGQIAMIFQEPMSSLNPVYTIGFQITEAIRLHQRVNQEQAECQAIDLLQEVKLLASDEQLQEQYLNKIQSTYNPQQGSPQLTQEIKTYIAQQKQAILKRYPHELSGGQLQRVMIAMAISCNPTLLIADEPTTALDVTVQATILNLLRHLCKERNMSMMFISHDLGVIANIADQVAVMYRGKIVENGSIGQILVNPHHPYTKGLLNCRPEIDKVVKKLATVSDYMEEVKDPVTGEMSIEPKQGVTVSSISESEEKQRLIKEQQKRLEKLQKQEDILSVENVRVYFPVKGVFGKAKDVFKAVDDVSFIVKRGETLGLVGESGCGKSTLARTILRLIPSTGGTIKFRSNDSGWEEISKLSINDKRLRRLRQNLQIVFQNPYNSLNPRLTIGQAIMEPMVIHKNPKWATQKQKIERVKMGLERVKLNPNWYNRYPHELSGGQRQRVCIARAIILDPKFIICDESVSALDVSVQAEVLNLLKDLQQEMGLTYIFISHDLSVVKFMSDRIMVMNRGQLEEMGTADEIINHPQKEYTQRLIASIPKFPEELKQSTNQMR